MRRAGGRQTISYSASLQYNLPYLHANVMDLGLPDFFNHLIPLVEASFQTPVANNFGNSYMTTGFIFPGVIWVGSYYQVGLEGIIPINKQSGSGVGVIAQLHLSRRHLPQHRGATADRRQAVAVTTQTAIWRLNSCA